MRTTDRRLATRSAEARDGGRGGPSWIGSGILIEPYRLHLGAVLAVETDEPEGTHYEMLVALPAVVAQTAAEEDRWRRVPIAAFLIAADAPGT